MKGARRVVLGSLLFALTACGGPRGAPAAAPSERPPSAAPVETASPFGYALRAKKVGSRYIFLTKQKNNRKVYVLRADSETGQYFGGNTGRSDFVDPHVTFFLSDGRIVVADAPAGTLVEKDKTVTMTSGVHAHTSDGKTLASDTMRYNDANETLYGDGNVVVTTRQGERLTGDSLVWNLASGRLDVAGAK